VSSGGTPFLFKVTARLHNPALPAAKKAFPLCLQQAICSVPLLGGFLAFCERIKLYLAVFGALFSLTAGG